MRRWECEDCDADQQTHTMRGRCGGPLDAYPGAIMDESGRHYIEAHEACGMADPDLRLYRCPVAMAMEMRRSLPALYAATQGGLTPEMLGHGPLTRGAQQAVNAFAGAWAWRRKIEDDHARKVREAENKRPPR